MKYTIAAMLLFLAVVPAAQTQKKGAAEALNADAQAVADLDAQLRAGIMANDTAAWLTWTFTVELMGLPPSLRNTSPSGPAPKHARCSRSNSTSSGGMGTLRTARRDCWPSPARPLVRPLRPRCSWTLPWSV